MASCSKHHIMQTFTFLGTFWSERKIGQAYSRAITKYIIHTSTFWSKHYQSTSQQMIQALVYRMKTFDCHIRYKDRKSTFWQHRTRSQQGDNMLEKSLILNNGACLGRGVQCYYVCNFGSVTSLAYCHLVET